MTKAFNRLLNFLSAIPDPRRAQRKEYQLGYVLLFTILAIVAGANSYRSVQTFIKVHRTRLNKTFGLKWKKPMVFSALRKILLCLQVADVEKVFRQHAANLNAEKLATTSGWGLAMDGKALRGSFDAFKGKKLTQLLSLFVTDTALVLAHVEIDDKTNEIPVVQKLMEDLNIADHIVTLDALHCQKKRSRLPQRMAHI
jgi:hypothetical protein